MELKPGLSALVTGGGSGIGKALCLALGKKGIFVTVVDLSKEKGKEVASLVEKENAKFHSKLEFPSSIFIRCDVTNTKETLHLYMQRKGHKKPIKYSQANMYESKFGLQALAAEIQGTMVEEE